MTITSCTTNILNQPTEQPKPINPVTGKTYFGQLAKDLQMIAKQKDYSSNDWATLSKWNSIGETIAKGERGVLLLKTPKVKNGDASNAEPAERFFLYNRCQLQSHKAD